MTLESRLMEIEWKRRRAQVPQWLGIASLEDPLVDAAVQAFCHGGCTYGEMMEKLLQVLIEDRKQNIKRIIQLGRLQPGPILVMPVPQGEVANG
jgi:hypothetical protein